MESKYLSLIFRISSTASNADSLSFSVSLSLGFQPPKRAMLTPDTDLSVVSSPADLKDANQTGGKRAIKQTSITQHNFRFHYFRLSLALSSLLVSSPSYLPPGTLATNLLLENKTTTNSWKCITALCHIFLLRPMLL